MQLKSLSLSESKDLLCAGHLRLRQMRAANLDVEVAVRADYTGRYARREDVIQAENGRDGNDSMSAGSEGFLSSSDEDEPPTTGEADL